MNIFIGLCAILNLEEYKTLLEGVKNIFVEKNY